MSADLAMVDTNVLVYAVLEDSEHFEASHDLLDRAQAGEIPLCLAPQVLAEFYSVMTNPSRVSNPQSPEQALDVVEACLAWRDSSSCPCRPTLCRPGPS